MYCHKCGHDFWDGVLVSRSAAGLKTGFKKADYEYEGLLSIAENYDKEEIIYGRF